MNYHILDTFSKEPQGQATFGMSNLRSDKTNLPFVVWISQKGNAQHDARVKVADGPKVHPNQMGSYAVRPYRHTDGPRLQQYDELCLEYWIELNRIVIIDYWDGLIEYTQDAIDQLRPLVPLP